MLDTTAVDRRFTPSPGTQGRTDKNLCRCFGAPARRVFPDHLITLDEEKKKKRIQGATPADAKLTADALPAAERLGAAWTAARGADAEALDAHLRVGEGWDLGFGLDRVLLHGLR